MKRIIFALLLIWMLPAAGQTPAAVDWRTLVDASELDRIENWERHFADAVRRVETLDMRSFYRIDLTGLADLARTAKFEWPARPAQRMAMCRHVEVASHYVGMGERHSCLFRLDRSGGEITKHAGVIQFDIRVFPDPIFGAVIVGEWWTRAETGPRRWRGPDRRFVGVMRQRDATTLHLLLTSGDRGADIPIIELGHPLPRQGR